MGKGRGRRAEGKGRNERVEERERGGGEEGRQGVEEEAMGGPHLWPVAIARDFGRL